MGQTKLVKAGAATLLTVSLMAGCSSGTGTSVDSGDKKEGTAVPVPKVTFYSNSGALNDKPQGSDAARLEEVGKLIRDQVGIDAVAIVPPNNADTAREKLNLLLSTNDEVDTFYGSWTDYADKGAIMPLNELLDKYGQDIKKAWPKESWEMMTDKDGKIWGIPRLTLTAAYPVYIRKDWLQKLNLQMPKTIDELEVILKTFKENDLDGNGKDDTIVLSTNLEGLQMSIAAGFVEGGFGDWLDSADQKVKPIEFAPGYKDFVAKMADWYQKGYIYKEAFAKHDAMELLKTNRVGAAARWYSHTTLQLPKVQTGLPDMDFTAAPSLTGPKGKLQTINPAGTGGALINKKAKNPEAVIKYINWIYQDIENYTISRYGLKDQDWKWTEPKKVYELSKDRKYAGEFSFGMGLPIENQLDVNDGTNKMHKAFLRTELLKLESGKLPFDYNIVYDTRELNDKVPTLNDIKRLRDEEITKFIMGARPISEWDKFIEQLNKAGMNKLIDAKTEQYNKLKK
ncbi:MAG: extracellular solute-binding protein [Paenibacillus sp.]|jgi:ABC-type glycerol-3-phosphate transport system substrate-binding protein|nr:extracellular solute-binding protein [Paenibacillus sp.]